MKSIVSGIEDDDVVPGKFIDSARNITWKMYDVPIFLDFWAKIYATFRNIIILDPVPAKMRDYCKISKELKSDGSNVAGVLCALAPEEKKRWKRWCLAMFAHSLSVILTR